MKFSFSRRNAKIGVLNTRNEKHGKEQKVPAADVTIKFPLKLAELDTIVITATENAPKFSEVMYDEKGNILTNMISPLKVNRKPEGLFIVIYDKELPAGTKTRGGKKNKKAGEIDHATALSFDACKAKDITLELGSGPNIILSFKVQLHPTDKDWARLVNIMEQEREVLIEARQEELFGDPDDADEEDEDDDSDDE